MWVWIALLGSLVQSAGCSNNPYPEESHTDEVVYYSSFDEAPRDLDPQRAYTSWANTFLSLTYESLLGYSYLERPLQLEPRLATAIPDPQVKTGPTGEVLEVRYIFDVRKGIRFIDDPCFKDGKGREMTASDIELAFKRIADPKVNCPVFDSFAHINGFREYRERIAEARERLAQKDNRNNVSPAMLYRQAGSISGVQVTGSHRIELVLDRKYPQILYWLAMRFVSAIPIEAIERYDGRDGSFVGGVPMEFSQRPVGTGPYMFRWEDYNREGRLVLIRNPTWWGTDGNGAPGTIYPKRPGRPQDIDDFAWDASWAGKPLNMPDRIEFRMEHESLPRFNKFIQGYYDISSVPTESFDTVVDNEQLSPQMADKGIRLIKDHGLDIRYIGFNMADDVVGAPPVFSDKERETDREHQLERNRKLRQALSLAIDTEEFLRIFYNRLGIDAQSPLPPGIPGYRPQYRNPYKQFDPSLKTAKRLLSEAGYPDGIDPVSGKALRLSFVVGSTSTAARKFYGFFVDAWRQLGVNVQLEASEYNKFQERMQAGAYQIFMWGWLADYPDPENFLFLLYGPNSARHNPHSANHTRYENKDYDVLFKRMERMDNDDIFIQETITAGKPTRVRQTRQDIIDEMILHLQEAVPLIPLMHSQTYVLYHDWIRGVRSHPISGSWSRYYVIDADKRTATRTRWNAPVLWPAWVLLILLAGFLVPAIISVRKERR